MKKIFPLVFLSSIALSQIFGADNQDQPQVSQSRSKAPPPASHVAPKIQRNNGPTTAIPPKPPNQNVGPKARVQPNVDVPRPVTKIAPVSVAIPAYTQRGAVPQLNRSAEDAPLPIKKAGPVPLPPYRQPGPNPYQVPRTDNQNDRTTGNNPNRHHRDRNEWGQWKASRITWEEACRRHEHRRHHPDWWRNHFTRFCVFGTGYYFWEAGYWYPAYGYDASYDTYAYEQPIASYAELEPAQVVANVQTELQRLGYYQYEVDGLMGPETQAALAAYQRDYGLEETSAIDEPTLISLGFIEPE